MRASSAAVSAHQRVVALVLHVEQRAHVADEAVRCAVAADVVAVVPLRPETVAVAAAGQRLRRLARGLGPALLPGPVAHRRGREQRPRRAPEDVLRMVRDVRAHAREQVVRELRARREPARDEEDAALAEEERRLLRLRPGLALHEVRLRAPELERAHRRGGEVERASPRDPAGAARRAPRARRRRRRRGSSAAASPASRPTRARARACPGRRPRRRLRRSRGSRRGRAPRPRARR